MDFPTPVGPMSTTLLRAPGAVPPLVCIELTYRCPRACALCFHWSRRGALPPDMDPDQAEAILTALARAGVARVRFTGGEPLLYPRIVPLLERARELGLEVWLNTAGLSPTEAAAAGAAGAAPWELLGRLAHDVLLPLRGPRQRAEMTHAARALRRSGRARVRFGAILTRRHLSELPELVALADRLGALLEVYRIASAGSQDHARTRGAELCAAVDALERLNRGRARSRRVRIANAVPFCVHPDPDKVARNAFGGRFDDGRSRLVVGPDGTVRPSYMLPLTLGRLPDDDLATLWRHPDLLALHDPAALPAPCQTCRLLPLCRGGSRAEALFITGNLFGPDPLCRPARMH